MSGFSRVWFNVRKLVEVDEQGAADILDPYHKKGGNDANKFTVYEWKKYWRTGLQQRLAIKAAVVVAVNTIRLKNISLQARLHIKAEELENYAKKLTVKISRMVLEDKPQLCDKLLSKVSKPELTSPLRNWGVTEDEGRSL